VVGEAASTSGSRRSLLGERCADQLGVHLVEGGKAECGEDCQGLSPVWACQVGAAEGVLRLSRAGIGSDLVGKLVQFAGDGQCSAVVVQRPLEVPRGEGDLSQPVAGFELAVAVADVAGDLSTWW